MSELHLRDVTDADLDAALRIRTRSFGPLGSGGDQWWRRVSAETLGGRMLAVVDGDDTLLGTGRIRPFEQVWGGRPLPMGGVAGVYVEPSARGRGVASLLTRGLITRMAELGDVVSCLFPTTATLYRGSGYEVGGVQSRWTYAAHALRDLRTPAGAAGSRLRPAGPADADAIEALTREHHARHRLSGPMVRTAERWRDELADPSAIVYLADDGYVAYGLADEVLTVTDLVAGSAETAAALWSVVGSGSSAAPTVRVHLEPHDPVRLVLGDLPERSVAEIPWMLRVIDLPAAMAGRGFSPHVTARADLVVADEQAPGNSGRWSLSAEAGTGSATPASSDGSPAAEVGPRGLAALWCGWTMSRLRRAGLATGGSHAGDAALDAIFAAAPAITEYF